MGGERRDEAIRGAGARGAMAPTLGLIAALVLAASSSFAEPTDVPNAAFREPAVASTAKILPPGATPGEGPSEAIFPPQTLTIRFDHARHVKGQKLTCTACHAGAPTSTSAADTLTPRGTACDACHGSDHRDLTHVVGGSDANGANGRCATCHEGYREGDGNRVAKPVMPAPNLVFSHRAHGVRNIGCAQCHGAVEEVGEATRDQLPRMRGCFTCHRHPDASARGDAKSACETCHVAASSGRGRERAGARIQTRFASGTLTPPRWMNDAAHTPDFVTRHKFAAATDSQLCATCHKEDECAACHDGRVRPRSVHPNDYLSMHAVEARLGMQRCTSCHREQSFCLTCHQRLGVAMSGPAQVRESGRFHPPKAEWSDLPRRPGHHAFEAMRNLNACVSCHIERDCVVCHGGQGIGGGFNPHTGSFVAGCANTFRRNPRPCLVCHDPGARALDRCR